MAQKRITGVSLDPKIAAEAKAIAKRQNRTFSNFVENLLIAAIQIDKTSEYDPKTREAVVIMDRHHIKTKASKLKRRE